MVTLERLTPTMIGELSKNSRSALDKVAFTYEKDTLNQMKYFICFIRFVNLHGFSISLTSSRCTQMYLSSKKGEKQYIKRIKHY